MSRKSPPPIPTDRSFGLTFAVVFAVVGAWLYWKGNIYSIVAIGTAGAFLLVALAYPRLLRPLNIAWMQFGLLLNRVVSPVVMGVIFFGMLAPIAVILRMRRRDVLQRSFDPVRSSYWIDRDPPGPDGSSFPRQF